MSVDSSVKRLNIKYANIKNKRKHGLHFILCYQSGNF